MPVFKATDLGDTIKASFTDGSMVFWDFEGEVKAHKLLQFHMHAPSEHTFDGKNYDIEFHFVH